MDDHSLRKEDERNGIEHDRTLDKEDARNEQTYRLEVRWDFTGTQAAASAEAHRVAGEVGGEVTAVFDESWDDV